MAARGLRCRQAVDLLWLHFQPSQREVVPDPHLAQAEGLPQVGLRSVYPGQGLRRQRGPVGNAGGQTGHRGLVPGRETQSTGDSPDVRLCQAGLQEGGPDSQFLRSPKARAVVPQVVHIGSMDEHGHPFRTGNLQKAPEHHPLAVIAAVGRVRDDLGEIQRPERDFHMADTQQTGDLRRSLPLRRRGQFGMQRQGQGPLRAQNVSAEGQKKGTIHTSGKGNGRTLQVGDDVAETIRNPRVFRHRRRGTVAEVRHKKEPGQQ